MFLFELLNSRLVVPEYSRTVLYSFGLLWHRRDAQPPRPRTLLTQASPIGAVKATGPREPREIDLHKSALLSRQALFALIWIEYVKIYRK
jgi:hypothetical protein